MKKLAAFLWGTNRTLGERLNGITILLLALSLFIQGREVRRLEKTVASVVMLQSEMINAFSASANRLDEAGQ